MPTIGLIFPPDQPPEHLREVATTADRAGVAELWLWEDCFATSGMAPAAAALAWTDHLRVGVGLFPVPLRNVALAAMEIASLARLFPDRLIPGIGHGVLDWMGQAGARVASPMTLLREYTVALRALLAGEEVTTAGRYVNLDAVRLRWSPSPVPIQIGAVGPKTIALAGELGDAVIFTGQTSPAQLSAGLAQARAARSDGGQVSATAFMAVPVSIGSDELAGRVGELTDAGAERVAVLGLSADGPPEPGPALLDLVEVVADVGRRAASTT